MTLLCFASTLTDGNKVKITMWIPSSSRNGIAKNFLS